MVMTTRSGLDGLAPDGAWGQVLAAPGVADVAAAPPGLATVGGDGVVRLWDGSGRPSGHSTAARQSCTAVAVTPDSAVLAAGSSDGAVHLWRRSAGTLRHYLSFSPTSHPRPSSRWTPPADARRASTPRGPRTCGTWPTHCRARRIVARWRSVAVSPGGTQIAVADPSGKRAFVRTLPDGDVLATLEAPSDRHGESLPFQDLPASGRHAHRRDHRGCRSRGRRGGPDLGRHIRSSRRVDHRRRSDLRTTSDQRRRKPVRSCQLPRGALQPVLVACLDRGRGTHSYPGYDRLPAELLTWTLQGRCSPSRPRTALSTSGMSGRSAARVG